MAIYEWRKKKQGLEHLKLNIFWKLAMTQPILLFRKFKRWEF